MEEDFKCNYCGAEVLVNTLLNGKRTIMFRCGASYSWEGDEGINIEEECPDFLDELERRYEESMSPIRYVIKSCWLDFWYSIEGNNWINKIEKATWFKEREHAELIASTFESKWEIERINKDEI